MSEIREKNFISAVIYSHNKENLIASFVQAIDTQLDSKFENYEIIVVEDNSQDSSTKRIKECISSLKLDSITLIQLSYYHGKELAMSAGIDAAIGDYVFEFDTVEVDYSYDLIGTAYSTCIQGFDIVSVTPSATRNSSKLFYRIYNSFTDSKYKLHTEAFRVVSRRAINRVNQNSISIPYRKAAYANSGLKMESISYQSASMNKQKDSKEEVKKEKQLAITSLMLFTDIAHRFALFMTMVMLMAIVFVVIYTIVLYVFGTPVTGWVTTILFLSFCFFGLFILFAIVLQYLTLLLNLVFKKQNYSFKSIDKIAK